jgi:GNAT superfamily N-acetyltransferase
MNIRSAGRDDFKIIQNIVHITVKSIYPKYYPSEVVDFFLEHHNTENIMKDIINSSVYILLEDNKAVGTGTKDGRYIGRVYVLPEYQGKGYGAALMNYLENEILKEASSSYLEASLPSYSFYLKYGYKPTEYHQYEVKNNKVLCYYVMEKELGKEYKSPVIILDN